MAGPLPGLVEQRLDALHTEIARETRTKEHHMTSNAAACNCIVGTLRIADGKGAVRVEDRFDTGIDDLWSALTDPGRLARWLGDFEGSWPRC